MLQYSHNEFKIFFLKIAVYNHYYNPEIQSKIELLTL